MSLDTAGLTRYVATELSARADPTAALGMAAYLKTDMPFYGIKKPGRTPVVAEMLRLFPPTDRAAYRAGVSALWNLEHREEKYAALAYARAFPDFIRASELPLYESLVRQGAWWDLVDEVAIKLVGGVLRGEPAWQVVEPWIDDSDLWMRRTAIICQIDHKEGTDQDRLFSFCLARADEREFFIRKAIGWALRSYSYTAPEEVAAFLVDNQTELSGLTYREGAKALIRQGYDL
ncbi:MAG: DNA alkylation repair protein [Acidimicrobiia bacterium]